MSVLYFALALALTISLLVVVHEYGHYAVARLCGIKVLRFSVGWGDVVWSRRAGPDRTEYALSALPIGGYVKMLDDREGAVAPGDRHRTFQAQPVWQRIAVLFAGPLFNFLFAVLAYWLVFVVGTPVTRPVIGDVVPESPAAVAGLVRNDVILAIGDQPIESWQDGIQVLVDELVGDGLVPLTVQRDGGEPQLINVQADRATARLEDPSGLFAGLGFRPWAANTSVGSVEPDSAAAAAGVLPGDRVLSIDGVGTRTWNDVVTGIRAFDGTPLQIELLRDSATLQFAVTPRLGEGENGQPVPIMGITNGDTAPDNLYGTRRIGVLAALPAAVANTWDKIGFTLEMFGRMLTGSVSAKNISGPLNIAEYAGETLQRGLLDYIDFLAIVSISLGVLNLLPVPMLDGGQIVYQAVEGITGRPISERWQIAYQQVGVVFLLGVMSLAFYNDIARMVGRAFG